MGVVLGRQPDGRVATVCKALAIIQDFPAPQKRCGNGKLWLCSATATISPNIRARIPRRRARRCLKVMTGIRYPLHEAVVTAKYHMGEINDLVGGGANINERDDRGQTPLHWAAARGSAFVTLHLSRYDGVQIDARDNQQLTPLHWAVREGRPEHVAALIYSGADVNAQDDGGHTPLHEAVLAPWSVTGGGPIISSFQAVMATLILYGANVNALDKREETPLHYAVGKGNLIYIDALMRGGADINACGKNGITPLHRAVAPIYKGYVLDELIRRRANVNAQDANGNTPLHWAVNENCDGYDWLIEAKANVNARNKKGETPLCFAQDGDAVKSLVEAGAKVNAPDNEGKTPLDYAKHRGWEDVVAALVEAGADN